MIKKNCVKCGDRIPINKEHHDTYGNWCQICNSKTGYSNSKKIKENMIRIPLESEFLKLRREVKLKEETENEIPQLPDAEYDYLSRKVSTEMREAIASQAQAIYTDISNV